MLQEKFRIKEKLISEEPEVKLLAYTQVPVQEGVSEEERRLISDPRVLAGESARTCYSQKLCEPKDYLDENHRKVTNEVIRSTRESGHLTTREHINFTFGLSGVSRQVVWSFLHSHPHYNSDQQSQRYVAMKPGNYLVPDLSGQALAIYEEAVKAQMEAYQRLGEILKEPAQDEYFRIFPARGRNPEKWRGEIQKKAQEVARYVLPVATYTNLWHTVSALTLMRLARTCEQYDVPTEAKMVVAKMVEVVESEVGSGFLEEIQDPLPLEETPEFYSLPTMLEDLDWINVNLRQTKKANDEFDYETGGKVSKLIGWTSSAERVLGISVRAVLGAKRYDIDNLEAVDLLLNPMRNKLLGEVLNITKMSKLSRALETVSYTFAKKISHTADSQDQRHRMTPAARPVLSAQYTGEPDYITPALIAVTPEVEGMYRDIMEKSFGAVNKLLSLRVPFEKAAYLLPNALAIRFVEQGTLLNLHHKDRLRLCYNAQEEIWRASIDEASQIEEVNPEIGKWLLPPCTVRREAGNKPYCPEGTRFCGVPVWNLKKEDYSRLI